MISDVWSFASCKSRARVFTPRLRWLRDRGDRYDGRAEAARADVAREIEIETRFPPSPSSRETQRRIQLGG